MDASKTGEVRGEKMGHSTTGEVRGEKMDPSTAQDECFSVEEQDRFNKHEKSFGMDTCGRDSIRVSVWECMYLGGTRVGTLEERLKVILDIGAARNAQYKEKRDKYMEWFENQYFDPKSPTPRTYMKRIV